ncbi:hypothetical protein [Salegentibacter chungangensis]|uniref:Lipocalin-like domain-containing protein n=1 Tax=Salegentibacter chungangensis TaxID=1335724 RepID=A0ABW3NL52_9FLAO
MKHKLLLIFLFISFTGIAQDLQGNWAWTSGNGQHTFNLRLSENGNGMLSGSHCAVFFNGDKIDCEKQNNGRYSLTLMRIKQDIYKGTIKSAASLSEGKIRLIYNKRMKNIMFSLTSPPPGEYYLPQEAVLERVN